MGSVRAVAIGYVVLAALLAWCTLAAVAPQRLPLTDGYLRWAFGFIINEVPSVAIYVLCAATLLVGAEGGLDSLVGGAAAVLTLLVLAGLAVVGWRATQAGAVIERALADGLGARWMTTMDAATVTALRPAHSFGWVALAPVRVRRRDVERIADISYGDGGVANTLDVYRRRSSAGGRPILIHLHGGALRRGRKNRQGLPLIYGLASRGWICISANYRLLPSTTFPGHLIDVKKIIAWARANGAEYGADPAIVFVAGGSSGAQLAALAALTANDLAYQPGFESADTSVTGAIALYGYYGSRSDQRGGNRASEFLPVSRIAATAPPFFIAHGDLDTLTSVEEARHFAADLRRVSDNPVVYAELPGAQHGFDTFRSLRADNIVNGVEAFAAWVRAMQAGVPSPPPA